MSKKKKRPLPQSLGLPSGGIDTHAHLNMGDFDEDLDEVLERAAESGVSRIGNVFLGSAAYRAGKDLFSGRDHIFFILGTHPNECDPFPEGELDAMREDFGSDPRIKAVGEIGLDYYWDKVPAVHQQNVFRLQLDLARELDLPVVIHSRDAEEDTVAILEEMGFKDYPVLWHCFGRDRHLARTLLDNGWMMSIPGPVSYPKNTDLREAVTEIPMDRMVLETDSPYLSPQSWRGKRNEPAFVAFTCVATAELMGVEPAELWAQCAANAIRFFRLED